MSGFWGAPTLVLALACLAAEGRAADFEIGPQDSHGSVSDSGTATTETMGIAPADVPVWLDAGDVPTAYLLKKYDLRTDFRLYEGGGILGKAYLGLFPRFFIGGAADMRDFLGPGPIEMTRDDAQVLARLALLLEDEAVPAVSIGWDGPAYDRGTAKGLYLAVSKEVPTSLCFVQFHGGLNSDNVSSFVATRDLRASAAVTTAFHNYGVFTGLDGILDPLGPRWAAGLEAYFSPITLGLEFRDIASMRPDTPMSRLLRVAWNGRF